MTDGARGKRVFTQEEVNAILSRAVESAAPPGGGLTYEELVDSARQAGISAESIDTAIGAVEGERALQGSDDEVKMELEARSWAARRGFAIHFTIYVMVSVLLAFANWVTWRDGDHMPWVLFPVLGWGIGIASHFVAVLYNHVFPDPRREARVREELARREERRRVRASREALKQNAHELGRVVERGMANLLADVAKNIREVGEVAEDAAAPRRREPGARVETRPRVDVGDEPEASEDEADVTRDERRRRRGP